MNEKNRRESQSQRLSIVALAILIIIIAILDTHYYFMKKLLTE
ncbi:hypothetical protein [Heliobacterium chlorum]|nr:hypothetical protein [Heliobacterium chlorum]